MTSEAEYITEAREVVMQASLSLLVIELDKGAAFSASDHAEACHLLDGAAIGLARTLAEADARERERVDLMAEHGAYPPPRP